MPHLFQLYQLYGNRKNLNAKHYTINIELMNLILNHAKIHMLKNVINII